MQVNTFFFFSFLYSFLNNSFSFFEKKIVLEQTVLAEANLIQIITATRSKNPVNYEADAPHRVSMEDRLNPEQLKSIQDQLQAAIELPDPNNLHAIEKDVSKINKYHKKKSNKSSIKQFARIVLARTYFECGQYETAVNIISQLSFEMDHVKQGYGLVLFLQARVIKGIFTKRESYSDINI